MRKIVLTLLAAALCSGVYAQTPLRNAIDSASYAFGLLVGNNLTKQMPPDLNKELVMKAMASALNSETMALTPEVANAVFMKFNQESKARAGEQAKAEGRNFLEANKRRPGVMTTASGLQYEILKKGTGTASPKATDQVKVHYHGTNTDGSVFDSSVERGEPIDFGLNQVISGWTEGVQLMHVGDKFKFYVPTELAYGEQSPTPKIKPNAALIFEVELLEIIPQ
jgi:FKBP-type peptidyl-prolyl cis-trans isomerase FklB